MKDEGDRLQPKWDDDQRAGRNLTNAQVVLAFVPPPSFLLPLAPCVMLANEPQA